jgi:hypothetical protein
MKKIFFTTALMIFGTLCFASGDQTAENAASADGGNIALTNFKGIFSDQMEVTLSWSTMMEKNVDHFEILRSGDGMNFQVIDSTESKMEINTNVYQLQYSYSDIHPLMGTSYYRIKVIFKNGYMNQSPVVQITNSIVEGTKIYPTLVQNNMIFVESDKILRSAKMEFFDFSGHKISETDWDNLNGRQNVQISKSGFLPTGTYVVRLTSNGQNIKSQLVLVQNH